MNEFNPETDFGEAKELLSRISFLGGIDSKQLDQLVRYFEPVHFEPGDCIIRKDQASEKIYIIKSGRVSVHLEDERSDISKREFTVGDHFGECAMLALTNAIASFWAEDACELIAFSRKSLARLHEEELELFCQLIFNIARDLARKLQHADRMLLERESTGAKPSGD